MSVKHGIVNELHQQARRNYPRRRVYIKGYDDLWQSDLIDMQNYAKENNGFNYILIVIDCFSKFVWAVKLKQKTAQEVTTAMERIFKQGRVCKNLQSDGGKEFFNKNFNRLMIKYKINHYQTYSILKASIVERVNRTIKQLMWKTFSYQGSYNWINILQSLVNKYNSRVHRTTGFKPKDVKKIHEKKILKRMFPPSNVREGKIRYVVNDLVRISKQKAVFDKSYTPNFSVELFRIIKIRRTKPTTYMLEDLKGQPIKGAFYKEEILKTNYKDKYLISKVLERKKKKSKVLWYGFTGDDAISWVNNSELMT